MIIEHIVKPFTAGIAVFVSSLTKAIPDDRGIIAQFRQKNKMTATVVKSKFPRQNAQFIKRNSSQCSGNSFKALVTLSQFSESPKKHMQTNRVKACHHHSFNGLQNSSSILKPSNSGYLNFSGKAMPKIAA